MTRLTGKTALVTGGGSGIGLAAARLLVAEGARVAIAGRSEDKLRAAATALGAGERVIWHAADVSQPEPVAALVRDVTARFGRIDLLVNNAGANIKERAFRELTPETWKYLVGANLDGAFYCMHAVLPQMLERKDGLIINVNSTAGKRAGPLGGAAYSAAKFGLRGLAMAVAAEEKSSGVRVSTIYPGEVDTPILEHRPSPVTDEHRKGILQAEDVAAAVIFIATLPSRAWVPELIIAPTKQQYA
jgi:NADP-dependent 3-hydroxy acid dehydrogenase YdfG